MFSWLFKTKKEEVQPYIFNAYLEKLIGNKRPKNIYGGYIDNIHIIHSLKSANNDCNLIAILKIKSFKKKQLSSNVSRTYYPYLGEFLYIGDDCEIIEINPI